MRVVDADELDVVDTVVLDLKTAADDVVADLLHEVGEQRHRLVGKEITAVLGGVGDDHIHLIEFLAGDGVGDQRHLVQGSRSRPTPP